MKLKYFLVAISLFFFQSMFAKNISEKRFKKEFDEVKAYSNFKNRTDFFAASFVTESRVKRNECMGSRGVVELSSMKDMKKCKIFTTEKACKKALDSHNNAYPKRVRRCVGVGEWKKNTNLGWKPFLEQAIYCSQKGNFSDEYAKRCEKSY